MSTAPAILFISAGQIGDAVLTTGLLSHLVETYPGARFTIVAAPLPAQLFRHVPGLERLIPLAKRRHSLHWPELYREVAGRRWDLVVDLRRSLLPWLLRAKQRRVMGKGDAREHRVVQLARLFGLPTPPAPRLWLGDAERAEAARRMGEGPALAVGPASNWTGKRWPAERFAALVGRLTAPGAIMADARVAVFASPAERDQAAPVLAAVPPARRIDATVGLDLGLVAAMLARARLFVGNDSGLMHIAAAVGAPTLGLFGPSSATVYAPWGGAFVRTDIPAEFLLKRAADEGHTIHPTLMDSLPLDRVEAAAIALFHRNGG